MKLAIALITASATLAFVNGAGAETASQREYKRGFSDCSQGKYDQNQHGASYKKGCAAAEKKQGGNAAATPAPATAPYDAMLDKCRARAARAYKASVGIINVKYEGQRVDGTHAVNGSVEGRDPPATFQCSFNRAGSKIVKFTRVSSAAGAAQKPTETSDNVPSADKNACLQSVRKTTNNSDIVILGTEFSEANNSVTFGVGPKRARWRCLVKHGAVVDVTSLTNEGAL
ncbi:hypothetical protein [Beijerinckia mobilis]|uniref:hypothetical protein n=1 Tax=Beijerinckia mobilis TaxID=231434 RepID=UPI000691C943|nr:hypothetical protein [Beijerinckia mobilis]